MAVEGLAKALAWEGLGKRLGPAFSSGLSAHFEKQSEAINRKVVTLIHRIIRVMDEKKNLYLLFRTFSLNL